MTTPVPPSSRLPNVRNATGLHAAAAGRSVTDATRECLRQRSFTLLKPLGKAGAFGAVFEATEPMQLPLAVKIVKDPRDRESRERHRRECQVLSSGKIPADLVPCYYMAHKIEVPDDSEANDDMADGVQPFLVMSRVPGLEVHEYVGGDRPLTIPERIDLIERLFEALARLHECGMVHGDPSPRNVLVEKDHRVRFVDLGGSRDIRKVIRSMMSTKAVGGTPGYAPKGQLMGDEQAAVWTDLRAMSAVAFDALTGQRHDENLSADEKRRLLKSSHVPAGVIRIILKGLREPDGKVKVDPSVFSTAEEVVAALRTWRQRRAYARQAMFLVPLLLVAMAAIGALWWQLESAVVERQWQTTRVLREQISKFSGRDATGVKELVEEAENDLREVEVQGGGWTPLERRRRLDVAADTLRRALDKGRRLEALVPRYTTLGEILNKIPWQADARGMATLRAVLENEFIAVGKLLDAGDADQAEPRLTQFAAWLISGWEANERARMASASRAEYGRLLTSIPARLQSAARYGELKADAAKANELWHRADSGEAFDLATQAFVDIQQRVFTWLDQEETAQEKAVRIKNSAEQVAALDNQFRAEKKINDELNDKLVVLQEKIATQAIINQRDRLKLDEVERLAKDYQQELSINKADLQKLKDTLKDASDADLQLKTINQKLEKFKAERDHIRAENVQLSSLLADANRKVKFLESRITLPGEKLVVSVNGTAIEFVWCPPGRLEMGSPLSEERRHSDEVLRSVELPGFWIMNVECYESLWDAVMGATPEDLAPGHRFSKRARLEVVARESTRKPKALVSAQEAESFATRLEALVRRQNMSLQNCTVALPTEEQFEYAIRAGTSSAYFFGNSSQELYKYAWFNDNSGGKSHSGGEKLANPWGIYDMSGGLWEWTRTKRYDDGQLFQVYRGGSFQTPDWRCRSAHRSWDKPTAAHDDLGLRVVLIPNVNSGED